MTLMVGLVVSSAMGAIAMSASKMGPSSGRFGG